MSKKKKVSSSVKEIKDINFYDKSVYDKLLLSPTEFEENDLVMNKEGRLYKVINVHVDRIFVRFLSNDNQESFYFAEYITKKYILRKTKQYKQQEKEIKDKKLMNFYILSMITIYTIYIMNIAIFKDWGKLVSPEPHIVGIRHIFAYLIITLTYLMCGYILGLNK